MKNCVNTLDPRRELLELKRRIEITEAKLGFVNDDKLVDALSYELLSLKSRMGYILECAKNINRY